MDLSFDLNTVFTAEIRGEELYIDGVHGPSVLDQMMSQYEDIGIGVRTSASSLTLSSARVRASTRTQPRS